MFVGGHQNRRRRLVQLAKMAVSVMCYFLRDLACPSQS